MADRQKRTFFLGQNRINRSIYLLFVECGAIRVVVPDARVCFFKESAMKSAKRSFGKVRVAVLFVIVAGLVAVAVLARPVLAHCDRIDGPVAKDVERGLEAGDVTPILKWVNAEDEAELKSVFEHAMRVRGHGDDARRMADRFVLETAIRLHRLSEGAPYTGIQSADRPLPAPVVAVDTAMEQGDVDALIEDLQQTIEREVRRRFDTAQRTAASASESVEAGRASVHAYVELVHYVKGLHETIHTDGHAHGSSESAASDCCDAPSGASASSEEPASDHAAHQH